MAGDIILDAQPPTVTETLSQAEISPRQITGAGVVLGDAGVCIAAGFGQASLPIGGEGQAAIVLGCVPDQGFARGFKNTLILFGTDGVHRAFHRAEDRGQDRPNGGHGDDKFGQGKPVLGIFFFAIFFQSWAPAVTLRRFV